MYFGYKSLICHIICKSFFYLILLMVSFAVHKYLSLFRSILFIFAFNSFALGDGYKKILLWFMSESVLPTFSSTSFVVSSLTFLIYFCIWYKEMFYSYSFICSYSVFLTPLMEEIAFLHCILLPPLSLIYWP